MPALATTASWALGPSVRPLVGTTRLAPELTPVRAVFEEMEDVRVVSLPPRARRDARGVVGIALPVTIAPAAAVFPRFATEEARDLLAQPPENLGWMIWTARLRRRIAGDDVFWASWTRLGQALAWARDREEWLALCR